MREGEKMITCPNCEADVTDSHQNDEPDVGIAGGYYCDVCDLAIPEDDFVFGDEVYGSPQPTKIIGTPLSEVSGRPGHPGYGEFCRIAKSWGHD
jgi:hypothetical protein